MLRPVLFWGLLAVFFASPAEGANKRHVLETGAEVYSYRYEETISGDLFMETKGPYYAFFANYRYHRAIEEERAFVLLLEGRWASGAVDYRADTISYDGLDDYMFEVRGLAGMSLVLPNESTIMLCLGLGYRYLNNGFEGLPAEVTGTYSGYNRESRYEYMPLRVDWAIHQKSDWGLSVTLEWDLLIGGEQKSRLEEMRDIEGGDPGCPDMVYHQDKGSGLRGAVRVSRAVKGGMEVFAEPFFRSWDIGATDYRSYLLNGVEHSANEPANTTREVGVQIGLSF